MGLIWSADTVHANSVTRTAKALKTQARKKSEHFWPQLWFAINHGPNTNAQSQNYFLIPKSQLIWILTTNS